MALPAFLRSTIGSKLLMAVSGLALALFLVAHLAGNLTLYAGRDAMNAYAEGLRDLGPLLWVARAGLIGMAVIHIATALRLRQLNTGARPVPYAGQRSLATTPAAKSMILSGMLVLAFALYHLAHFTWGLTHPEHHALTDELGRPDVYSMVVLGFSQPLVTLLYLAAMVLLGLHLSHALSSLFQTLGWRTDDTYPLVQRGGYALTGALVLGFISLPLAVVTGIVALPPGVGS